MADCGPNCDCADCCIKPESYTDVEFGKKTGSPGIVLATPESFPVAGATGNYFDDVLPTKTYNPIDKYTADELASVLTAINDALPILDGPLVVAGTYPDLEAKLKISPINTVEVANFIEDNYLTPTIAVAIATTNPQKILNLLNTFFSVNLAGIALCNFLQAPFGIMKLAEDLLNTVVGLLDNAKALIDGIVTTAQSIIGDIKNFVEEAKKIVDSIIENVKEKLDNIAKQFKEKFEELKQNGLKLGQHFKAMAQKFADMVNDVKAFFSDINKDNLKAKIEEAIVNAANAFGQLTVDIVDHLLFIFCGITTDIEKQLNAPVEEVKTFATNFEENVRALTTASNGATNGAVEAGRPTATPQSLAAECERYASEVNSSYSGGGVPAIVYTPEYTDMPAPTEWSNLRFAADILQHSFYTAQKRVYMYDYPDLAEGRDADGTPYLDFPNAAYPADTSYRGMKLETLEKANQVARELGVTFYINSAFRAYPHQQFIRNVNGGRHAGGGRRDLNRYPPGCRISAVALHSQHSQGTALDISKSSIGNVARCTAAMRAIGFGGVGTYNSFMHYDLGPVRSWGG